MVRTRTVRYFNSISDPKLIGQKEKLIKKYVPLFIAGGGVLGAAITYMQFIEKASPGVTSMYALFSAGIVDSQMIDGRAAELVRTNRFVDRPSVENQLKEFAESTTDGYLVVYGDKYTGKSCAVEHALKGMKGVTMVKLTNQSDTASVLAELTECVTGVSSPSAFDRKKIYAALSKVSLPNGRKPTIVFEVQRKKTTEDLVGIVQSIGKDLSPVARIIIVLSEANSVLVFGDDDREDFLHVADLTHDEADNLISRTVKGKTVSVDQREFLYDNIGRSVGILTKFCESELDAEAFVARKLRSATEKLVAFRLTPILRALKEHPEGVSAEYFKHAKFEGIDMSDPQNVGLEMKVHNAIKYDMSKKIYLPLSRAHEVALRTYEPPLPPLPTSWYERIFGK